MTKVQKLRYQLAELGIECTIEEVEGLIKIAAELTELSKVSSDELKQVLDLKDPKQKAVFDAVQKIKKI